MMLPHAIMLAGTFDRYDYLVFVLWISLFNLFTKLHDTLKTLLRKKGKKAPYFL